MADIYGSHFEYGNVSSRIHNLIIATLNTDRMIKLSGDISGSTIFNKIGSKRYLIGDDMTDSPLSFDVEFITDNDSIIPQIERRTIEKWLFNRSNYKRLYFDRVDDCLHEMSEYVDGAEKRLYLNCRFINPEKIENECGVVGYKATLEADSNMFWQDAVVKSFERDPQVANSTYDVDVDTDCDDYIYPKVTFTLGDTGGEVIIFNASDDNTRLTKFVGLSANATIIMNGDTNYISGQNYQKFSTRNFIRLLDGTNSISVVGDVASISFEFQNRRNL